MIYTIFIYSYTWYDLIIITIIITIIFVALICFLWHIKMKSKDEMNHKKGDIAQLIQGRLNSGSSCLKAKPIFAFLGLIIIFINYWDFQGSGQNEQFNSLPEKIPEARNQSHIEGAAYVFLAMGAQANQMNCPAAIESLVRYSGWDGDIYLISDQPRCFDENEIVNNAGMKKERFHFVTIGDESFSKGGVDWDHPAIGFRKSRVRSFTMKTRLFDIIDDPKIQIIAYADCDILFAQPDCAKQFITNGPPWEDINIRFSHIAYATSENSPTPSKLHDIHAGTFVVHRKYSQLTLLLWHYAIELGLDEGDNNAYLRMYELFEAMNSTKREHFLSKLLLSQPNNNNMPSSLRGVDDLHLTTTSSSSSSSPDSSITAYMHTLQHNPLTPGVSVVDMQKSSMDSTNWFEKFFDPHTAGNHLCMNHISKARCSHYGRELIQSFVAKFQLKTYHQNRYYYCTAPVVQPLLYGWFPFGYLPFCPKMEMIW